MHVTSYIYPLLIDILQTGTILTFIRLIHGSLKLYSAWWLIVLLMLALYLNDLSIFIK